MENTEGASSKLSPLNDPEQELYTIPSYSSWFSWDDIDEIEKVSLKEFFDGSSITRTPKVYKAYRDFIINKFREEPLRRLTFTEIRKSLIGDVNLIHKVFLFLEKWGLINFSFTTSSPVNGSKVAEESSKVKFEEGAPNGVRVVAIPNPSKIILLSPSGNDTGEAVNNGFRLPPLASYSDVFGDLLRRKESVCGNCGETCESGRYESTKGDFVVCINCFKSGKYGESKTADDFKFIDCKDNSGANLWTDAETHILLESVLKHGDDWDLVAKNVQTKSKVECISRLIQLPFGEFMLGSANGKSDGGNLNGGTSSVKQGPSTLVDSQEPIKRENQSYTCTNEADLIGEDEVQGPPLKQRCIDALADASGSLMKQVALLSTMVGPHVTAAAAEATVRALCNENQHAREIFEGIEDKVSNQFGFPNSNNKEEGVLSAADLKMGEKNTRSEMDVFPSENSIPLALRIRVAIATAFGGAAAHAKLLADQEDREIEYLMATIIETQLKKIHCKIKHFQELELIMDKEYSLIQELKESLIEEWIDVLQQTFNAGVSRWRDHATVKSFAGNVF
ncbi:SWI/SNF complex subunit SWI3A [Macadamia integrifolia]|uniref:SWI/SNF complex subunit SWI3A n=1 Tax=Macadamia integrifolia TaxID=60698 RepID=UPI001C4EA09F|nr:SWI/SNF complex subunit SWI3A [Macadamia integrifolia]